MNNIIETLFDAFEPERQSPAEKEAVKAAEGILRQAEAKLTENELESLTNALLCIGSANCLESFTRGLRLGVQLTLEGQRPLD